MSPHSSETEHSSAPPASVSLPAPTAWPIVLAFGVTLVFAGLVTSAPISLVGAVLAVAAAVGWFGDVLPQEKEETVEVKELPAAATSIRREVERLPVAPELPRALLPLETYTISAGIRGGLAGSMAMAVLACLYGLLKQGSIWYPINLLAAAAYAQSLAPGSASLRAFHLGDFLLAVLIHGVTSLLVGLLYGAMLPMFSRRPILLGGLVAPILWTGLLRSILGLIDPLLNQLISWPWFIASQFAFGVVAGLVVVQQQRVRVRQFLPFSMRAGVEAAGITGHDSGGNRPR
jgi:hypothetical protein